MLVIRTASEGFSAFAWLGSTGRQAVRHALASRPAPRDRSALQRRAPAAPPTSQHPPRSSAPAARGRRRSIRGCRQPMSPKPGHRHRSRTAITRPSAPRGVLGSSGHSWRRWGGGAPRCREGAPAGSAPPLGRTMPGAAQATPAEARPTRRRSSAKTIGALATCSPYDRKSNETYYRQLSRTRCYGEAAEQRQGPPLRADQRMEVGVECSGAAGQREVVYGRRLLSGASHDCAVHSAAGLHGPTHRAAGSAGRGQTGLDTASCLPPSPPPSAAVGPHPLGRRAPRTG